MRLDSRRDYNEARCFCYTIAMNSGLINQIVSALRAAMPANVGVEVEKNMRAALEALFARLDLVTREELEVQRAVLARARVMLEKLEQQVAELERSHKP